MMIGNDIVDLDVASHNSRWKEQRFLDKLFSAEEQDFILSEGMRFQNIWRLWSMKESAYKIISRRDGRIHFNPKDFKCSIKDSTEGHVVFEGISFFTLTEMQPKFIQTVAFLNTKWISEVFQLLHSDVKPQHQETYQSAIRAYADLKCVPQAHIEITKNKLGIPLLYINGTLQEEQLSISHHGSFGTFAMSVQ